MKEEVEVVAVVQAGIFIVEMVGFLFCFVLGFFNGEN